MSYGERTKRVFIKVICICVIAFASTYTIAVSQAATEAHNQHMQKESSGISLSADLKTLLNQEMSGIDAGMRTILSAIAAGDWATVADTAIKIKDSFILKQKLTPQQMEELHQSLPADFVKLDQDFHVSAEKLAHAAKQHDAELVNFYFYRLNSQCVGCHSQYAAERFPNLSDLQPEEGDHH